MTPTPPPTLPGVDPAPLPPPAACELLTVAGPAGWQRCGDPGAPTPLGSERSATSSATSSGALDPSGSKRPRPASSRRSSAAKTPPASAWAVSFFTGATRSPCAGLPRTGA